MPKFKIQYETDLVEHYKDFGVNKIFNPSNEFNKIIDEKAFVSQIVHQSMIDVDEKGTEASAVTVIMVNKESGRFFSKEPIDFILDRPFGFFIVDFEKDLVLFSGVYGLK